MTDFGLILTYFMIGVTILACIISPVLQIKNNPTKMRNMLLPVILLAAIFGLSVLISSNEVLSTYSNTNGVTISSTLSKIVGGSLITFYTLSLIAISTVIYSEFLHKLFKNGKK